MTTDTPSITSSASFAHRAARAELARVGMLGSCFLLLLTLWTVRRLLHGIVVSPDVVFFPVLGIQIVVVSFLACQFVDARRRIARGTPLSNRIVVAGAAVELLAVFATLALLHLRSPRGAYVELSAPVILLIPMILLLSVMRLRPMLCALMGAASAVVHWALVAHTMTLDGIDRTFLPVLANYGVFFLLTGLAAALLARTVRNYIADAVDEAAASERAQATLRTIERELDIAREIQAGLLPATPPVVSGFEFAGMARPAAHAGGDYYDWQPLADGRTVVAIADVTGHGIGPALVMAVCRAYARATAPSAANAAQYLERLNTLLVTDQTGGRFITMAVAIVSPGGGIELLSAGHGPTFLHRAATGAIEQFGGNGVPLGIMDDERYAPSVHLELAPGDTLVLATDGFVEQSSTQGGMFGADAMAAVIREHAALPPKEIIDAIDRRVQAFAAGKEQADDMTIVVLRRTRA